MPERQFFKYGDEVESTSDTVGYPFVYVGPIGPADDGEHILFDPEDKKAYRTYAIGSYRRRTPRKGELWGWSDVAEKPYLVVHATPDWVIYTRDYVTGGEPTRNATYRAEALDRFMIERKRVEEDA